LRAISRATWFYDQVQRTHTAVNLERQGWDRDAAITYAALAHGGYSTLGPYKNWARYTFFVHSFRILMPIEVGKSLTAPFKMALDKATGKPIKGKARTAVKAFIATLAIPQVIHAGLTEMGWEPEEIAPKWWDKSFVKRRVLGRWKYKKAIMHDGEKREAVIGVNNIINMPVKWIDRLTKQQPHKMKLRDAGLFEVFRWELHPFYRIIGDAFTGEASMGDIQPWRAGDPSAKQVADAGKYIWLNMFRLYLEGLRHLSPDNESFSKYRMKQREELNSALNVAEKVLLTMELSPAKLGYAYTRKDRMARVQNMGRSLKGAIREAKMVAGRFPDSEERSQELDEIQEERLRKIETMYGTRIPRATSRRRRRSVVPEATLRF